jgi:hypothetical protein
MNGYELRPAVPNSVDLDVQHNLDSDKNDQIHGCRSLAHTPFGFALMTYRNVILNQSSGNGCIFTFWTNSKLVDGLEIFHESRVAVQCQITLFRHFRRIELSP